MRRSSKHDPANVSKTPLDEYARLKAPKPTERGAARQDKRRWSEVLARVLTVVAFAGTLLTCAAVIAAASAYAIAAQALPSADRLAGRAEAQSTKIFDRNGELLYEVFDPNGGRRTVVPIAQIPTVLKQATIATEDPSFYSNLGVDPRGVLRAIYYLALTGKPVGGGGSTITQQLVRNTLITPEPTIQRKIREAILALEVTRRYSKDQILEYYLNVIPYGNLAYGIEAAAETYFNKRAQDLTLPEATLLAGLPQAPATYDPCVDPTAALARQQDVLRLMIDAGYLTPPQAITAAADAQTLLKSEAFNKRCTVTAAIQAPHFVVYVRELLEQEYGPEVVYKGGLQVYTTLDMKLQRIAEDEARKQIAALAGKNVTNASLIALNPRTGEILAMLGSVDFFNKQIDGQVNVAIRLRQPGSSIKPINYVTAFEKGWTPATVIADVNTHFLIPGQPDYVPVNYDLREHGLVPVRTALASSFNIPAVKTLQFVGVTAMIDTARKFGITTFKDSSNYGLSLTLGGGDVTLLELTGAYAVFANLGARVPPTPFLKITDPTGKVLLDLKANPPKGTQVVDPRYAYEITSILSDVSARAPAFGTAGALRLTRPAAAKTGTTNDWRDNWTLGYTPDFVAGVWVGNSDNSEMEHISGISGAGPLWHNFMERALAGTPVKDFLIPPGMVRIEVCNESGGLPTDLCPPDHRHTDIFLAEQAPTQRDNVWQKIKIDRTNGLLGSDGCPDLVDEKVFAVYPPEARQWAIDHAIPQPPTERSPNCPDVGGQGSGGTKPSIAISSPREGNVLVGSVDIVGTVQMPDFDHYLVQIGFGNDPQDWIVLVRGTNPVQDSALATWDTRRVPDGAYTIRLEMDDRSGHAYGGRVHVVVQNVIVPTPRPTMTRVPTPTPSFTATPIPPTATSVPPTRTPIPPTATPAPPTPTRPPTPTPTAMPTATPTPTATLLVVPTIPTNSGASVPAP
ncbi:MAG: PBP1A family penicillin-binding protein [Chloroflexota bacterium]|nr:PBP1A family penicillin-binding protein [Chloroflexota bacterium]